MTTSNLAAVSDARPTAPAQPEPNSSKGLALRQMLRPVSIYLRDDEVREVTIPRPGTIFVRIKGAWHEKSAPELTFDYLKALVATMASYNNVNFSPIMSLKLLDGERGQVMQPPAVLEDTISINIRKHSSIVKSLDELTEEGAFSDWQDTSDPIGDTTHLNDVDKHLLALKDRGDMRAFLEFAALHHKNIIIGGKTGSGKTTFARSLIERIPDTERLITIEDVHELFLPNHPNRVHLIYGKGVGQVSATDCVEACMRSSPDRIFLSELRGAEAWEYLAALNTGHPGSITTIHANSARDVFDRVAMLIKQSVAGNQIDVNTLRSYLHSTLDIALYFANYKLAQVYFKPQRPSETA
ncbi:P-type DNA transfer ATPase VirB11 [Pusillimonas sp. 7-48]|uniref:Type IV secretion system protein n=2 Tax=Pusillimonas minor TaxID=2697024 RepID=A0A842HM07_9BURK|nr:P-type DNA transfer ATPase VirB11 [Pusillimonas minor]